MLSFFNWNRSIRGSARKSNRCQVLGEHRAISLCSTGGSNGLTVNFLSITNAAPIDVIGDAVDDNSGISDLALNRSTLCKEHAGRSTGAVLATQASCCLLGGLSSGPKYYLGSARCFATAVAARNAAIS